MQNKELIENISNTLKNANIEVFAFAKDIQNYKPCNLSAKEIMNRCFEEIETSEPSIGIGVESGLAYFKNIPIYLIAKKGAAVSNSIKAISQKCIFYNNPKDLLTSFKSLD